MYELKSFEQLKEELGDKYDKFMYAMNVKLIEQKLSALDFIDQVLQYHLQPFDYKQVDEDINTLIGILRGDDKE